MRVATYSRVSTAHHDQNPELQVQELRRYCAARGWLITQEFVDHGYSGATEARPGLKELLTLIRAREVDTVVVVKLDRLFRSLRHLVATLEDWSAVGVLFVATKDNLDYTTPAGRFFIQVLGSLAEFEKSLLHERTMMGLEHARASGKRLGRPRLHDPSEVVRLRLLGLSYREIGRRLGIPMGCVARAIAEGARKTSPQTPNTKPVKPRSSNG